MAEEVIKEASTSTLASAESKREICPINATEITDGNSVPSYLRRKEKPVPHYRRASTGSCHDSCKFGTHHSSESREDCPIRAWRQDRANARLRKQDQAEVLPRGGKQGNKDQAPKIFPHVNDGSGSAKHGFAKQKPPLKVVPGHSESSPCVELPGEVYERKCLSFDDRSNCGDGGLSEGAVSIDLEMPLAIQDSDESDDHVMDAILPSEDAREDVQQSHVDQVSGHWAIECVSSEKRNDQTLMAPEKHKQNEHGTKSESSSREPVKPKTKATLTVTRNTVSSHKTGVKVQRKASGTSVESSDGPRTTAKRADVSATIKVSGEKKIHLIVASTFPKLKEIKVPSPASATDSSAKSTRLSKLKASATKIAPAPSPTSGKKTGRKMAEGNVARKDSQLWQNKGEEKVILSPLKLSRSINMSAKSLSTTKMRAAKKETSASPVKSKKVYGIECSSDSKGKIVKTASPKIRKPDVNNKVRQSHKEKAVIARTESAGSPKSASISSSTMTWSPRKLTFCRDKAVIARTESAGRPRSASLSSSTVTRSPRKLTFRRGKMLTNLASNSPRRVRFRPAKATDDSSISKDTIRGRITRKSGAAASDVSRDSGTSRAEVIVLRHQDANEQKKSEHRSFNNVIKETASRLIEARKSKVKALVGAFETVISLQEKRGRSSSVSIS